MSAGEYPPELDEWAPAWCTPEARVLASGVPDASWEWVTAPPATSETASQAREVLRRWSSQASRVCGVVLHGGAGLGKTGVASCIVRDAAIRQVGARGWWSLATSPAALVGVAAGEFRRRPAPASFYRWRDLKSLLDRAKAGSTPWDESPPLTAEKVLREVEGRCVVLALDDVDVDAPTPWKEEVLLRLLELPSSGARLVLTLNVNPAAADGITKLGERVVDRLMDPALFARFHLSGDSIRRRTG